MIRLLRWASTAWGVVALVLGLFAAFSLAAVGALQLEVERREGVAS